MTIKLSARKIYHECYICFVVLLVSANRHANVTTVVTKKSAGRCNDMFYAIKHEAWRYCCLIWIERRFATIVTSRCQRNSQVRQTRNALRFIQDVAKQILDKDRESIHEATACSKEKP
jgi:hypothetical protein